MRRNALMAFLIIFMGLVATHCRGDAKAQIKRAFDAYKRAAKMNNGKGVAFVVSSHTIKHYEESLRRVLHMKRADLAKLGVAEKMRILMLRQTLPKDKLLKMTGTDLLIQIVAGGKANKSLLAMGIANIKADGKTAVADALFSNRSMPFKYRFYYEDDRWRFDLSSILPGMNKLLEQTLEKQGSLDDKKIIAWLEKISRKKVSDEVWEPIKK